MSNYLIPTAIIIAGALIAGSVLLRESGLELAAAGASGNGPSPERTENALIYGDPDAPVKIVEFSDFECPFCGRLHPTLTRIVDESDGRIAWEYRHLPLPSHQNAEAAAYAGECIGRLGGNDAFWSFAEAAFDEQSQFSNTFFEREAARLSIDADAFNTCIESDEIARSVEQDRDAAVSLGGRGTPFSVIVYADGTIRPVSGALPYETWNDLLAPRTK